jgi:tyrosine-protein phosphatase YwqE
VLNFFKTKEPANLEFIGKDVHSHLLPGMDDGVQTFTESVEVVRTFRELGYRKLITTPHVNSDHFPNKPEDILNKLDQLRKILAHEKIDIQVEAAAEYMIDEAFLEKLNNKDKLLTFGGKFVLVETGFYNQPVFMQDVFFKLNASGYKPVLAHPERYSYLQPNSSLLQQILESNILLQLNLNSLNGIYGKGVQNMAEYLIDKNLIHLVGSDCHNSTHAEELKKLSKSKYLKKLSKMNLLNHLL